MKPVFEARHPLGAAPVRLWVFPGQGAQKVGMGLELYDSSKTYQDVFNRGSQVLLEQADVDLRKIVFDGPQEELTRTLYAQPALLVSNNAYLEHLKIEEGIGPAPGDLMAGHSLGEWNAYTAAKAIAIEEAALAVYYRGKFMEEAFPYNPEAGSPMAAVIGLDERLIDEICSRVSRECLMVVPANLNTPNQVVISGHPKAIEEASGQLRERGATKVIPLKVAGPFHSPLMESVKEKLSDKLRGLNFRFAPPQNTIISNCSAHPMTANADHLASLLNQITGAVRWNESMKRAWELGAVEMVNVDITGRILLGMAKEIFSAEMPVQSMDLMIPMHRHALRLAPGTVRTTVFTPSSETRTRRVLEFSYDAGAVAQEVKKLMNQGEVSLALLVLDNRYNASREEGMRELQSYADSSLVQEAMKAHGFVSPEGEPLWPTAIVRDLESHSLSDQDREIVSGEIFKGLSDKKIGPPDVETLLYYVESRWGGDALRLEEILKRLRRLLSLNPLKLALTKFKGVGGEEQKGIASWDKVILYVDWDIGFHHPGAMTQGECG